MQYVNAIYRWYTLKPVIGLLAYANKTTVKKIMIIIIIIMTQANSNLNLT